MNTIKIKDEIIVLKHITSIELENFEPFFHIYIYKVDNRFHEFHYNTAAERDAEVTRLIDAINALL